MHERVRFVRRRILESTWRLHSAAGITEHDRRTAADRSAEPRHIVA